MYKFIIVVKNQNPWQFKNQTTREEFKLEGHKKDIMEGHPACLYFATIENILH